MQLNQYFFIRLKYYSQFDDDNHHHHYHYNVFDNDGNVNNDGDVSIFEKHFD